MKRQKGHSEREFLKRAQLVLIGAVTWMLLSIFSELLGSEATDSAFGRFLGRFVLPAVLVLVPLLLIGWFVLYLRTRRRSAPDPEPDPDPEPGAAPKPPVWQQPDQLHGRESEVDQAAKSLRSNGIVVVCGPRDIGTSAVAAGVVQQLIDEHDVEWDRVTRFDLRSRSSRRPDDARATAGRIVSAFGLDEPADGTEALLADAGRRLVAAIHQDYDLLMLDNVSTLAEVDWLTAQWPRQEGPPLLVIAGESAIRPLVQDATVVVGELDSPALLAMWHDEVPEETAEPPGRRSIRDWVRRGRPQEPPSPELDALLRACFGRPGAVKAFAREHRDNKVAIGSLLAAIASTEVSGALERVWSAIFNHAKDSLSADAVWLLHALAELPVTALRTGAIAAMLNAHRDQAGAGRMPAPLEELRVRNLVQETEGRYRVLGEVRRAVSGTVTEDEDRQAYARSALPTLLDHSARLALRWAARLDSEKAAADWFHDAERSLRPLFNRGGYGDTALLAEVITDLGVIADALEAWYVREQQAGGLLAVNENLHALAERVNRPDLAGLATIRKVTAHRLAGRFGDAAGLLDVATDYASRLPAKPATELTIRRCVEQALLLMAGSAAPPDLARAEAELSQFLTDHPNHPARGTALINLGALCIRQSRPDVALAFLRRAEKSATDRQDMGCRAHALELRGTAMSANLLDAVRLWRQAQELFTVIGDEQGEARCLQHLGSAALHDPAVAGQIRDGRPHPLRGPEAAEVALPLLRRAKQLRAGQPDTTLVDHYLSQATRLLKRS